MPSIHGEIVYTGDKILRDTWVSWSDRSGAITAVGAKPRGEERGSFPVLTPAFVDPHCHIGMFRFAEGGENVEGNEQRDAFTPDADALDSVLLDDRCFAESIEMGVLYSCVTPGSGNVIGGRMAVIRNYAADTSDALIGRAGLKAAFGYNTAVWGWQRKGTRASTRMGNLELLRREFDKVLAKVAKNRRARGAKKDPEPMTRGETILAEVLAGKEVLRCHAHKSDDIASVLRLAEAYKLKVTIEHAMDVHDPATFKKLKAKGISVVWGPIDGSPPAKVELKNEHWRNAGALREAGVDFLLMSDHPVTPQSLLLQSTRALLRAGFDKRFCIELLTRKAAAFLGIDKKLGTLARGRWASLLAWNGDPFDLAAWPVGVFAEGRALHRED